MGPNQTGKLFAQQRKPKRKQKDNLQNGRNTSNDATDNGLTSKISNNLYNSTAKKPIKQWKNGQKT